MTRTLTPGNRILWSLLFALAAGPLLWGVHLGAGYAIASAGCALGWNSMMFAGLNLITEIVLLMSLVLILITLAAALVAFREWRRLNAESDRDPEAGRGAWRFLALFSTLANGYFAFVILFATLPFFFLNPCSLL